MSTQTQSANVLVLTNRMSPGYREGLERVVPYLEHLGVPYTLLDVAHSPLPSDLADHALLIAAHGELDAAGRRLGQSGRAAILAAVRAGMGLVTFDPRCPAPSELGAAAGGKAGEGAAIRFSSSPHTITSRHPADQELPLAAPLRVPALHAAPEQVLLSSGDAPLLAVMRYGRGRIARWATTDWIYSGILGPLAGLDDVLWRSLVWAARKPFALRGLAPVVTMLVDDVAGTGELWQQPPLYWVHAANRYGFKPSLAIFPYNLSGPAIDDLRELMRHGLASASPHALGRPPRTPGSGFSWYEKGLPWQAPEGDEFVFFDHLNGRPFSDAEVARRLTAVDEWVADHAPFPTSGYINPHWCEIGTNAIPHICERWGADSGAFALDADTPYRLSSPWPIGGPFRLHERPGTGIIHPERRGQRPVYYADFINLANRPFFNCFCEIRDDAGYEWKPDNDVPATIGRGVRQLQRALDSMALAVLYAHETDHIYKIAPPAWEAALAGVARGIGDYDPIFLQFDEAIRYVRATRTSRLESCSFEPAGGRFTASFAGQAALPTHFYLFTETGDQISARLIDVPAFDVAVQVPVNLRIPDSPRGGTRPRQ